MVLEQATELSHEYAEALRHYLAGGGEPALQRAFELGRKAVQQGLGSIDLALVHHSALADTIVDPTQSTQKARLVELGSNFFAEILAPIEMSHRGYQATRESLPESEERYRTLVESARDIIFTLSPHGIVTTLNPAFEALTGLAPELAVGKHFIGMIHHDDLSLALSMFERALSGEIPPVSELRIPTKENGVIVCEFKVTPKRQDGNTIGIFGIATDITHRKMAEEQLKEQARLLEAAHDAIVVCALDDRVTYWNRSSERLYGWSKNEALGKNLAEVMRHRDQGDFIQAHRIVLESDEWHGPLRQTTRDGKEVLVESRWTLVHDTEGNPRSILIVNRDITETRKLEDRLLRYHRMETMGRLATGVAHDLNDMLAPILLGVQTLGSSMPEEQHKNIVSTIESSIAHGAAMIERVLTFARGGGDERTALQIQSILFNVVAFARETFPKSVEVKASIPDDVWSIRGDRAQLEQLVMNMFINARDAMPDGGIITAALDNIVFDENYALMNPEAKAGAYVVMSIADSGVRNPAEAPSRDGRLKEGIPEYGIAADPGLTTIYSIVRSHNGFVRAQCEPGRDTEFKVYLPTGQAPSREREPRTHGNLIRGNGETILIVDDEVAIREITRTTLETFGYRVMVASDGAEAVAMYADHMGKIDLVFTDMMMLSMSGASAIRSIRNLDPRARIIATSGVTSAEQIRDQAGVLDVAFLSKPYTAEKLLTVIRSVLTAEGNRDHTPEVNLYAE